MANPCLHKLFFEEINSNQILHHGFKIFFDKIKSFLITFNDRKKRMVIHLTVCVFLFQTKVRFHLSQPKVFILRGEKKMVLANDIDKQNRFVLRKAS